MSGFLESLHTRAGEKGPRRILLPEASDARVLQAALDLKKDGLIEPIMVYGADEDVSGAKAAGLTHVVIEEMKAKELENLLLSIRAHKQGTPDELTPEKARELSHDPLVYGMYLLRTGDAAGLVAGAVRTTSDVARYGLWLVGKKSGIETVSSAFYMVKGEQVLTFADCGFNEDPTAEQLADIAIAAADARKFVVGDEPRVAFLSYSTHGSGGEKNPSIRKIRAALKIVREKRPDIRAEGEIQADAALVKAISERKINNSAIGNGEANVFVFPNLDAGNISYKLVQHLSGAHAIGPVGQGFARPVNDLSRGASVEDIKHSVAIAALQAE